MSAYWWVDRVLPGVASSSLWYAALWLSHRKLSKRIEHHDHPQSPGGAS